MPTPVQLNHPAGPLPPVSGVAFPAGPHSAAIPPRALAPQSLAAIHARAIWPPSAAKVAPSFAATDNRAACEVFGTWGTALHYAGVRYGRRGIEPASSEQILQQIRQYLQLGRSPMAAFVRRHHYRLYREALRCFGTWRQALSAAGVDIRRAGLNKTKRRPQTNEEIFEALRVWHAAGHSMAWSVACLENRQLAVAAHGRFHGWRRALLAAGIPVTTAARGAVAYGIHHGFSSGSSVDSRRENGWMRMWWPTSA